LTLFSTLYRFAECRDTVNAWSQDGAVLNSHKLEHSSGDVPALLWWSEKRPRFWRAGSGANKYYKNQKRRL